MTWLHEYLSIHSQGRRWLNRFHVLIDSTGCPGCLRNWYCIIVLSKKWNFLSNAPIHNGFLAYDIYIYWTIIGISYSIFIQYVLSDITSEYITIKCQIANHIQLFFVVEKIQPVLSYLGLDSMKLKFQHLCYLVGPVQTGNPIKWTKTYKLFMPFLPISSRTRQNMHSIAELPITTVPIWLESSQFWVSFPTIWFSPNIPSSGVICGNFDKPCDLDKNLTYLWWNLMKTDLGHNFMYMLR